MLNARTETSPQFYARIGGLAYLFIIIAGLYYLINSFALILAPGLANQISPAILLPPFVGELSVCLWLIFKGVNLVKWNERVLTN